MAKTVPCKCLSIASIAKFTASTAYLITHISSRSSAMFYRYRCPLLAYFTCSFLAVRLGTSLLYR